MEHVLVIDASPLIYRVFSSIGHLATSKGEPTGLRFGFLRSVRSYQNKLKADKVAIVFDSKGPVKKAEGVKEYKANREFTDDKATMYGQVPALREMLSLTKWAQLDAPGYEADDIIATLARTKALRGDRVTIVSPDNDFLQMVGAWINIFKPGSSKEKTKDQLLSRKHVLDRFGVEPFQLLAYRAIVGDVSDNLSGAFSEKSDIANSFRKKVEGRKTCIDRGNFWSYMEAVLGPELTAKMRTREEVINRNLQVMELVNVPGVQVKKGEKDLDKLEALFFELEFNSMFKYLNEICGVQNATE